MASLIFLFFGTLLVGLLTLLFWRKSQKTEISSISMNSKNETNTKQENKEEKCEEKVQEYPNGSICIYFGSQTGTAEGFARVLCEEADARGFGSSLIDLEDFEVEQFRNCKLCIFLMATYGEGEPTDNAVRFTKWIKNKKGEIPSNFLENVQFTVFGLGNTQYEHFNAMGKLINSLLEKLGARRIYQYGEGDDDSTLEDDFETWKESLWSTILSELGKKNEIQVDTSLKFLPELPFDLIFTSDQNSDFTLDEQHINHSTHFYFDSVETKVLVNRELRAPEDGGSTIHVEIGIHGTPLSYQTADNLAILAENDDEIVESFASAMGFPLDETFTIQPKAEHMNSFKYVFPTPCSVRTALKKYCDLVSIPRKTTLKHFGVYITDETEKQRFEFLVSKDGRKEFRKFVEQEERSLAELLSVHFPSIRIPFDHFLHFVPHLQPRYYTISSSSSVHPQRIHATVSLINHTHADGRVFNGVCSSYLKRLVPPASENGKRLDGDMNDKKAHQRAQWPTCHVFIRASSFRLPEQSETPIILIGPGTGVAPMRALLQERQYQRINGRIVGETILYFGCKSRNLDYLYKEELEAFLNDGTLTHLHLAFSREQEHKVYVQHKLVLKENAIETWNLIANKNAYIYVCGGTAMGTDVHKALIQIVQEIGTMSEADATLFVKDLQTQNRYVQELWA